MKPAKRSEPIATIPHPSKRDEEIRRRAYELYETRGREDGHDLDDWLQAKAEVLGTRRKTTAI